MFTVNRQAQPSDSGKLRRVASPGVQQFSGLTHHDFRFYISRRTVGMTIKRTSYSVSIDWPEGGQAAFLADLPTLAAARQAAEAWIDAHVKPSPETKSKPPAPKSKFYRQRSQRK